MNLDDKIQLATNLSDLWDKYEEQMGEQAAYLVACEELNIHPDEGYELLALIADDKESGGK